MFNEDETKALLREIRKIKAEARIRELLAERAPHYSKAQLEFLIDLALLTDDKEWFMELTGRLKGKAHV
jgi:uncharacterized protein YpiB (UPF0302 family)